MMNNSGETSKNPLDELSKLESRIDSIRHFLSLDTPIPQPHLDFVSDQISSTIRHVIINATALLSSTSSSPNLNPSGFCTTPISNPNLSIFPLSDNSLGIMPISIPDSSNFNHSEFSKSETVDLVNLEVEEGKNDVAVNDWNIIELDSMEILAEHVHFCEICGKGFKRDANLRMHMRAHGDQFKTTEALAKPVENKFSVEINRISNKTRFSCPYVGCIRNKKHTKFRPLKSVICVKNHFKRSHCPKMYTCNRCNKKSFSVLADLKSHLKHCGEAKWKCSCGTTFSRKDKLFGHMALFEGHMPAVREEEEREIPSVVVINDDDDDEDEDRNKKGEKEGSCSDNGFFDGLLDGFGDIINGYNLQDVLGMGSPSGLSTSMDELF